MKNQRKLTSAERLEISILLGKDYSLRAIGRAMGRSPNTIAYEVGKNHVRGNYDAKKADQKASVRKRMAKFQWRKIREDQRLEDYIVTKLKVHWNPDEISGSLRQGQLPFYVSKTTIYEWLYSAAGQRYCPYLYSRRHTKRRRKEKRTERMMIPDRVGLDKRPFEVNSRREYGHYEGDTVVSRRGGQGGMSVLLERKSRFLSVKKLESLSPTENLQKIQSMHQHLNIQSITFDNGQENRLHIQLGMPTFFCDAYSSWQKGGVENGNKLLRRYFPKGTDFRDVSQRAINQAVKLINQKPRKILGYRSALEVAVENGVVLRKANLCYEQVS